MDFTKVSNQHTSQGGWWIAENAVSLSQPPTKNTVPPGFTREYHILAEVCASLTSGFMLLNQGERITYSNQSALRLLHVNKPDPAVLQDFDLHQHLLSIAADPQIARSALEQVWENTEQEYTTDLALADAATSWLRLRSFPVRNDQGEMLGRGLLFDDITLEHSALASRAETLTLAAHELKTPLAIIKGCATTLLGGSVRWDPTMQREMLQMIDAQSDRLYDVLNTLLDVWRFDAGTQSLRLSHINISDLLLNLVKRWQKQAPDQHFVLDIPSDLPPILCDALRIEQTLNHLLQNAVTYAAPDKIIRIQLETNEIELRVSVSDEGIGIAQEHLERIFDRFYRIQPADERITGSGLGLSAARATIQAHGGKIWADSLGLGHGATFYFTLPLAPRLPFASPQLLAATETPPILQKTSVRPFKQDRRLRVLLGENDARLTRYVRANLEEQQYRVQTVSQGMQFLRQMDLEEPDIIVLSTRLADMGGIELLQRLREFSHVPVIMLSDECDEDERVHLLDLGSDDLLIKPFGMKELLARIRALLRRQTSPTEHTTSQSIFTTGDLMIDHAQHIVTVQGRPIQLSRTEYKLLSTLAQNVGMVVTHELLLEKVWGPEYNRDIDFIWVYISRLRRKIETDSRRPKYILTVPDVGYKLLKL